MKHLLIPIALLLLSLSAQAQDKRTEVLLETTQGNIRIALYNETPKHRDWSEPTSTTHCSSIAS